MSKRDKQEGLLPVSAQKRIDQVPERHHRPNRSKSKRWCRGREGREHVTEIRLKYTWLKCRIDGWHGRPFCGHELWCTKCGKIIDVFLKPEDCPDLKNSLALLNSLRR